MGGLASYYMGDMIELGTRYPSGAAMHHVAILVMVYEALDR